VIKKSIEILSTKRDENVRRHPEGSILSSAHQQAPGKRFTKARPERGEGGKEQTSRIRGHKTPRKG